ncbi:TIGR02757 family protein [Plebeiibacterium sediminum]|uniref:TIGR02757 family protein n=1 Tax=Plebeiibacterium sediminum TaxID=2992112 RepID=A0AAE3M6P2_9BACT|nr:TIGR02757 family protein [Plebeiobacterium sediminum]MCW3787835.1 TIGR02757 family protein [Plebeiobacterium sediminum]
MNLSEVKEFLDEKVLQYNAPFFIESDPISIPKKFSLKQDIEIAGFIAATLAWGQRKAIMKSAEQILEWMDYEPYHFIMNGEWPDLGTTSVYRTFNGEDLIYFFNSLRNIYMNHGGLEDVFTKGYHSTQTVKGALSYFRGVFTSVGECGRTGKHVANVDKGSSSKRLNMYLRWMVRKDKMGVDFGLWEKIKMSDLMLPLDVHTGNVGRKLGILERKQSDWKSVEEITSVLKSFDTEDPIKYDYALFGLGVFEKF